MAKQAAEQVRTVLDALVSAIRTSAGYDRNDQVAPAAILWTDEEKEWQDVLPSLRKVMPELLTLGTFDSPARTGPAIWIKTMLARPAVLPEAAWPDGAVPVIYLPGIGRAHIRAIEETPPALKPLAELQFRGVLWTQTNAKDWTVRAFLQSSDGGLGLQLSGDQATLTAMRGALRKVLELPVAQLSGRVLDASDFHDLLAPDPAKTLLEYLSEPEAFRKRTSDEAWGAFRTVARDKFKFDPDKADPTKAGQMLAERQGLWAGVWKRFEESPKLYPGIQRLLQQSKPAGTDMLFGVGEGSVYPQDNQAAEDSLRAALVEVGKLGEGPAREKILELEKQHGGRRASVWAKLGFATLAQAIEHLAVLADATKKMLAGPTPNEIAASYAATGWRADAAAMDALAVVKSANNVKAVGGAVAAVYKPWLEKSAEHLQKLVVDQPLPGAAKAEMARADDGCCVIFADGLRMDLGRKLYQRLTLRGMKAEIGWRWSTIPSVTATAKPAASPVADRISQSSTSNEFGPQIEATKKNWTSATFKGLLKDAGITQMTGTDGDPSGKAWLECGTIDHRGHSEGAQLAGLLDEEVRLIFERVESLLAAGWQKVRIVTDHGWLLLPGGMPKATLPKFVLESRWGRCAEVKADANPDCQLTSWHWNPQVNIACAPGISCFQKGYEYAHGGISVQECVTPVIEISAGTQAAGGVTIESATWSNLLCKVIVKGAGAVSVDLRRDSADATSSLLESPDRLPIVGTGGQSKLYAADSASGTAEIVALDASGKVIARRKTNIGVN